MRQLLNSIDAKYQRYKALGEAALEQLQEAELNRAPSPEANSVAVIVWHIAGNLESRFTDFLTADGEKPWRDREEEFADRTVSRHELMQKWERGWAALHRSLAHTSYHVGQIVYVAKAIKGNDWRYLSIPPGGSAAYNQDPALEQPREHAASVNRPTERS